MAEASLIWNMQTVVIGNNDPDFADVPMQLRENQHLVDFVRIGSQRSGEERYDGICW
jgi:hypothetical protein